MNTSIMQTLSIACEKLFQDSPEPVSFLENGQYCSYILRAQASDDSLMTIEYDISNRKRGEFVVSGTAFRSVIRFSRGAGAIPEGLDISELSKIVKLLDGAASYPMDDVL